VSDELTDDQRAILHAALEKLREELTDMVELSHDAAQPVDLDQPIGRVSRIDAIQQQQMADSNRRNAAQRLRQVNVALAAFDRGEYGLCATCEEPIAFRRLEARPEARMCVGCQSARER
jgi:DnaK suppressor protein